MKLLRSLEKTRDVWYLLGICVSFFILRFPSLFEPYWYGDEGIYQVVGRALLAGRLLYQGIWDNKPPLLYLLYALFNSDQFLIRFVSLIFGVLTVISFYALAKNLFEKSSIAISTTALFALLFGLPLLEGNIANAENFMLFPILVSASLVFEFGPLLRKNSSQRSNKGLLYNVNIKLFLAGLLLGIAFLFKAVAVFDMAAFVLFLVIIDYKNNHYIVKTLQNSISLGIGFALPILATILFFLFNGALLEFIKAAFVQNVGYVGYGNQLLIPQGFLILKLLVLCAVVGVLFLKRNTISRTVLFIILWGVFSLFNAFFSARPYTHYVLVFLPSFCLSFGVFFAYKNVRTLTTGLLLVIIIALANNFWFYGKTFSYYPNFIAYLSGVKSTTQYQAFFDKGTPNDYLLADFINMRAKKKDTILLWGNNAQVYTLTHKLPPGRFTVAYHMSFSKNASAETKAAVEKTLPRFIIIMPNQTPLPFQLSRYKLLYTIGNSLIYERF